jgi:hypothetical protein
MALHTHMLNPRRFLEDTIRDGFHSLWASGMPWHLINQAIDTDFNYTTSADAKSAWISLTGRSWENADDALTEQLSCPYCSVQYNVPWTTCGGNEHSAKGP